MKTVRIGNYDVSKDDVGLYIQHFGRDKSNLFEWDRQRKVFHDNIFKNLNIDRFENREFSDALDKFCEPHILKYDRVTVAVKKLMRANTAEEIKTAELKLNIETQNELRRSAMGCRNFQSDDIEKCRICGIKRENGMAFVNDHLANADGFDKINAPICMDCSEKNPDDYFITFKKQYWGKNR